MAPSETVKSRALIAQDVLSTFDDAILPSEVVPSYFANIERNAPNVPEHRPQRDMWTVSGDLHATLLQWASYDKSAYDLISSLQTRDACANYFQLKLRRRFEAQFELYDAELEKVHASSAKFKEAIAPIVDSFRELSQILSYDRQWRQDDEIPNHHDTDIIMLILETLQAVCVRRDLPQTTARTRRLSESTCTLCGILILQVKSEDELFLVGSLKHCQLMLEEEEGVARLERIEGLLRETGAPAVYMTACQALRSELQDAPKSAQKSEPTRQTRSGKNEPRPGLASKRAPEGDASSSKRGRRGT